MSYDTALNEESLALARNLVASIEAGEMDEANRLLDELTKIRESALFQEVGKLTRELHNALSSFQLDTRISDLAEKDIPDARERLRYVVSMTDQAANRTLNAVEESIPLCMSLSSGVEHHKGEWERFLRREMSADEFRTLSNSLNEHLAQSGEAITRIKDNLNEVLMAQDFQDLTGQIIHRVITLVEDVENNLVGLIKVAGQRFSAVAETVEKEAKPDTTPTGPVVPGVDSSGSVSGQDEVDDLLSSLGF